MPFFVVPILPLPAFDSLYPSTSVWYGIVIDAKGEIFKRLTSTFCDLSSSNSCLKDSGRITVPAPSKQILSLYKIPDGIK